MKRKITVFVLASLTFLGAITAVGVFASTYRFLWSQVISHASLYGFCLIIYSCWSVAVSRAKTRRFTLAFWLAAGFGFFFSYMSLSMDRFLLPLAFLAMAAGFFGGRGLPRIQLACALGHTVYFGYLIVSTFWHRETSVTALFFFSLAALFLYMMVYRRAPVKQKISP